MCSLSIFAHYRAGFAAGLGACGPLFSSETFKKPIESEPSALAILRLGRPLVIAHRGFSTAAPENTLPAFRLVLDASADLVEPDGVSAK